MGNVRRRGGVKSVAFLASVALIFACSPPDGAFQRCAPGTVADQAAGQCVSPLVSGSGGGGQGGLAGASGEGQGGAAGTCALERLATDSKNCGVCGRDCRGAACQGGACVPEVLADQLIAPYGLALDGTNLAWASPAKSVEDGRAAGVFSLARTAGAGAAPSALFGSATLRTRGFARAASGDFLWGDLELATLSRRNAADAQPTAIATGRPDVNHLVAVGDYIYWTQGPLNATKAEGGVYRAALAGSAPEELAKAQLRPDSLTVDDEGTVYWVNRAPNGQVMRSPKGETPEVIERLDDPIAITAGGGRVVWAERSSGRVASLAKGASTAVTLVRDESELVEGVAIEGAALYRITFRSSDQALLVKRSALDGTAELLLARITPADAGYLGHPLGAFALAFDETFLYVADPGTLTFDPVGVPLSQRNGRLYRVLK